MNIPERFIVLSVLVLSAATTPGCKRSASEPYVPGLGEIMTFTQMRHSKLWFAGRAGNWPLAAYEADELREGFGDAVRYDPTHDGVPISELLPRMTSAALAQVDSAISAKDRVKFEKGFDALTAACNACHEAAHHGFNVIERPSTNPFTNQRFEVPDRSDAVR